MIYRTNLKTYSLKIVMTTNCKRFRNRWTIKECLDLQREFELLEWPIDKIALKHKRTPNAIMLKLDNQGLADYNVLYNKYHDLNSSMNVIRKHTYDEFDEENIVNKFIDEDQESILQGDEGEEEGKGEEEGEEDNNLHERINQLESHVAMLTELVFKLKQNTNKSVFASLFS